MKAVHGAVTVGRLFISTALFMAIWDNVGDFFGTLLDAGEQEAVDRIQGRFQGDHIAAQNQAVAEIGNKLNRFHATGAHTSPEYIQLQNQILGIAQRFESYAKAFNTARAMRGASEVTALAKQIAQGLESERTGMQQIPYSPNIPFLPSTLTSSPYFYPALALGAVFVLPRLLKGRR